MDERGNGHTIKIEVPEIVYEYAKGMAKYFGVGVEDIILSEPIKKFWEKVERRVTVTLPPK